MICLDHVALSLKALCILGNCCYIVDDVAELVQG